MNEWAHITCIHDNGTNTVYINGVFHHSQPHIGPNFNAGDLLYLGGSGDGYALAGYLADIRLWERGLSAEEVTQSFELAPSGAYLLIWFLLCVCGCASECFVLCYV